MDDLISRKEAISYVNSQERDCNPDHFEGNERFIEFMDDKDIGSFGWWQFANGFNMGITAAIIQLKNLPKQGGHPVEYLLREMRDLLEGAETDHKTEKEREAEEEWKKLLDYIREKKGDSEK